MNHQYLREYEGWRQTLLFRKVGLLQNEKVLRSIILLLYFKEDILNHIICIVLNSWIKKFKIFELSKTVLNA